MLKGERPRLQLFGDTVNTAARIETSGIRNRIHVSEHTANYIKEADLESWISPRDEIVSLKGKGKVSTFWLHHQSFRVASNTNVNEVNSKEDFEEAAVERRIQRCVDWSSELLCQLLKSIVAHRTAVRGARVAKQAEKDQITEMAMDIGDGKLVVEEVANIIELPEFDFHAAYADPESVELPPKVVAQCHEYVSILASMYKTNPFHNFEREYGRKHIGNEILKILPLLSHIVSYIRCHACYNVRA